MSHTDYITEILGIKDAKIETSELAFCTVSLFTHNLVKEP